MGTDPLTPAQVQPSRGTDNLPLKLDSGLGQPDEPSAHIGRIRFAAQVAVSLQVAHELVHGLLGHPHEGGEFGHAAPIDRTEAKDLQVSEA